MFDRHVISLHKQDLLKCVKKKLTVSKLTLNVTENFKNAVPGKDNK